MSLDNVETIVEAPAPKTKEQLNNEYAQLCADMGHELFKEYSAGQLAAKTKQSILEKMIAKNDEIGALIAKEKEAK